MTSHQATYSREHTSDPGSAYCLKRIRGISGIVHTIILEKATGYAIFYAKDDLDVLKAIVTCIDVGLKPKIFVNGNSRISKELRRAVIDLGGEIIERAEEGLSWEQGVKAYGWS